MSEQLTNDTSILTTADILKTTSNICILTGAGISAESGIPTFRDKQTGLWERFRAEDLANIDAFNRDPKLVWSWYQWRRGEVKDKTPNPAHYALAQWQAQASQLNQQLTLVTQNVDDLHEQAGSHALHLHGELWKNHCSDCGKAYEIQKEAYIATHGVSQTSELLHCQSCDGIIRPSIVWFGEMLPQDAWYQAQRAAKTCEVFISVGTSSLVYPAAGLAQSAKRSGAIVIEINPNPTGNHEVGLVDIQLPYKAGLVLPVIIERLFD